MPFVYIYDFRKETLERKKDMILHRFRHVLEIDRDTVYVFGGESNGFDIDRCEKYDLKSDSWLEIASLPAAKFAITSTKDKNYIYISGIHDNEIYRFELEI